MRILCVLSVVAVLSSCNCGPATNCTPGGDAGPQLRGVGEPCTDGQACQAGLTCGSVRFPTQGTSTVVVDRACMAICDADGGCGANTTCLDGSCHPTCTTDTDCNGGRFSSVCQPIDAGTARGYCTAVACSTGLACPASATCIKQIYCCPPGAPCAAPPNGFCLK